MTLTYLGPTIGAGDMIVPAASEGSPPAPDYDPTSGPTFANLWWAGAIEGVDDDATFATWEPSAGTDDLVDTEFSGAGIYRADGWIGTDAPYVDFQSNSAVFGAAASMPAAPTFAWVMYAPSSNWAIADINLAGTPKLLIGRDAGNVVVSADGGSNVLAAAATAPTLCVAHMNGGSSKLRVNGDETTGNTGTFDYAAPFIVLNWLFGLVGVYNGDLTADEGFASWEAATAAHYGITLA